MSWGLDISRQDMLVKVDPDAFSLSPQTAIADQATTAHTIHSMLQKSGTGD